MTHQLGRGQSQHGKGKAIILGSQPKGSIGTHIVGVESLPKNLRDKLKLFNLDVKKTIKLKNYQMIFRGDILHFFAVP